ncbi:pantetheine-phosphate adenylyltransferase [Treponema phagedenis]|uniref:Phosphopantetheine adenylyltransferase n=1 Tax=Treponema phagedenis TaxID=162 RepID=A0A0B7GTR9_TREPH|nr:pantetheine-phosphate adenylyltransferase [Treponema phagedenis]NVP24417.1 pantetheine-phosphate adenylyltransferase [Treponema phagedenis]QEJ95438.1 pantetheine-phosphate adenylyltransferase [Treponema phagedenis]QEJ97821.1 pantetheine-phosphate adenylyltransferase [Treponema phagedenis]QEK01292.1 pantetheine-phosphate adenylyltransferase [Treponema phagedenis]QEK03387.1 pantetheine-phosphate adenylyltransferase [Treponema phagedenis]
MVKAVFAGSFDPPTYGHLNIIERARKLFSEVHVVIAVNQEKQYFLSNEERLHIMEKLVTCWTNVRVSTWDSLIVNYAEEVGAEVLIRGVRNTSDFSYEFDLAMMNKGLKDDIDTIFLAPDPQFFVLRSSSIKELALFGGDISAMVPPIVEKIIKTKLGTRCKS